jgi:CubicO group peptidase (beta-lactamase class C family)
MKTCARPSFRSLLLLFPFLALAGTATGQEAHRLTPGEVLSHVLAPGETRVYEVPVQADRFVSGRVEQDGVEVAVTVRGPSGSELGRFALPLGKGAPMAFRFTAEDEGAYRVEVAARTEGEGGAYRIRLSRVEPVATTPEGRLDQAMSMFAEDTPGGVVAVIRHGRVDFLRAWGSANLSDGIPFTGETVTNIGSTSKQFTGFALALLESRGELSLDDDVRLHVPEIKDFGETVTLRNLLTHTTGYREFVNTLLMGGRLVLESDHVSPSEVIDVINRQPRLQNSPGTEFNYNNTAFHVATLVVERVTGRPFHEWMEEEVFHPLGMTSTWVRVDPGQVIPRRAAGYTPGPTGFREVRDLGASQGAGGIYTTPGDLARWMGNLGSGALGGPEVIRALTTRNVLADGDTTNYGLGIFVDRQRGLDRWQHGGSDVAHRSTFIYYPELDAGYVVLGNYAGMPGGVGNLVAEAFFGEHLEAPAARPVAEEAPEGEVRVPSALLEAYEGRYSLSGMVITISRENGGLQLQITGQPAAPLRPTSDSTFTLEGVEAEVTFHAAADGGISALTLHQAGDHRAERLADVEEAPVDLTQYEGRYFSEELETFFELVVEDEALVIRHRRFGPAPLTMAERDRFTGSLPVTTMDFERDGNGAITGFRAGNGRAVDIWFERVGP